MNYFCVAESGTETLRTCLKIIEAYLLLCPQQFMHVSTNLNYLHCRKKTNYRHVEFKCPLFLLQHFCSSLASSLHSIMSDIREDGQILILRVGATM
jgi:hypothetical protein